MPKINILPEGLANKIAAGEVVERPASVVKELVENAIDAGSRRIFVSLLEGGIRRIAVQDDGEGVAREDALLAFQRHATSKVAEEADLSTIATLGFRGEALPSIASVAKIRLVTQAAAETEGTEVLLEGGQVLGVKAVGAPKGSLFEVSDLFYNTPARRKFLKSAQTELSHASDILFQLALSHPMIHFRLTHGKKVLLDAPAVSDLKDRILQLFGEDVFVRLMEAHGEGRLSTGKSLDEGEEKGLYVDTFFSRPPLRGNHRKDQYLFVNQRPVRSPLLSHAVYDAYGSYLMKGEHPFFILFLSIDPAAVDVNVHPMKREVRFQQSDPVHEAVRRVIRTTLSFAGMDELPVAVPLERLIPIQPNRADRNQPPPSQWIGWPERAAEAGAAYWSAEKGILRMEQARNQEQIDFHPAFSASHSASPLIRPLGQIYGTFLLAEIEGEFALIDQHTAHERILYERFLERWRALQHPPIEGKGDAGPFSAVQPLLVPQQIDLPVTKAGLLRDYLKDLALFGWGIEHFGETTFLVREVPALISKIRLESFLHDLTDDLAQTEVSSKAEQPILNVIASMACHGAIRANQPLTPPEIEALLKDYFEMKTPPTCPHGRPILLRYPLLELEKLFRRK